MTDPLITKIHTDGYRSQLTNNRYLAPGMYRVGGPLDIPGGVVPLKLARYLVGIGKAEIVATTEDAEPVATTTDNTDGPVVEQWTIVHTGDEPSVDTVTVALDEYAAGGDEDEDETPPAVAYNEFTKAELDDIARNREIPYSGKVKADLIADLIAWDNQNA